MKKTFILMLTIIFIQNCFSQTVLEKLIVSAEFYKSGNNKLSQEDFEGAILEYDTAILISPHAEYYGNRWIAKASLNQLQAALEDFNYAIKLNPKISAFYGNRGKAKQNLADFRGSILDYSKAILLHPNDYLFYYNIGYSKYSLKDYKGAIIDYTVAIKLNPTDKSSYGQRGLVNIILGRKETGCLDLSKAGELGDFSAYDTIKEFCN